MVEKIDRRAKKREKVHQEILNIAAQLINDKGSQGVSLEEIAQNADIARKTVYNHFDNKEAIIRELVMPVCTHAMDYLEHVESKSQASLEDLWSYCLEIWQDKALNIELLYQVNEADFPELKESKHGFIIVFKRLLKRIPSYGLMTDAQLTTYAEIIYVTNIPLLKSIHTLPNYDTLFRKAMTGLLNGLNDCR